MATVSPSHPSPLVIQITWTVSCSLLVWCAVNSSSLMALLSVDERRDVVGGGPVQDQAVRVPGHETGAREAGERVRDRRPLGADELPDQPVGERQRDED